MEKNKLLSAFLKNNIICETEKDIYQYGIECIYLMIINYLSLFVIAIIMGMFKELLLLSCSFIPLRKNAGGFHAKTKIRCYFFSCMCVWSLLLICNISWSQNICFISLLIANFIIILLAPLDNMNRKMSEKELKIFRRNAIIYLGIIDIVCILIFVFRINIQYQYLIGGVILSVFLLVLGKIKI